MLVLIKIAYFNIHTVLNTEKTRWSVVGPRCHENLQQDHCSSIANALMMVAGVTEMSAKMSFTSYSLAA